MKNILALLFLLLSLGAFAQKQEQERPLVQFTGMVRNADSTRVIVPYVSIVNQSYKNQVNLSNYKGYFSFVAHEQDTLRFSCVGYASVTVVIPANVPSKSYTLQVALKPQIINLPVFHVFPWATTEEFRKDFVSMKLADDDLEIARKNVSRTSIVALQNTLARDGQEIQSSNYQGLNNSLLNQHSLTPNPLLNPLAWGSLIKSISEGDKSRGGN
ncbi:hypothetical protein BH09BAC6_BH09BAC6_03110 [soil metagenome]|jgi:hypothetical protein